MLAVVLMAFLVVSAVLTERTWRTAYDGHASGRSIVWANDTSRLFVSASDAIVVVRLGGDGLVWETMYIHGLGDGPLAYGNGWLYFAGSGYFLAIDVRHPLQPQPHGPVLLGDVIGDGFFGVAVRRMRLANNDLFVAGRLVGPNSTGPGVVSAIDVTDPTSITWSPASLRVRYTLRFDASVMDVLVRGDTLYVLEGGRFWKYSVADGQPLQDTPQVLGGSCVSFDLSGSLLAVADASDNRSVVLYEISDGDLTRVASVALSGGPSQVTFAGSLVYVSWHPDNDLQRGLAVFDLPGQSTLRLLAQLGLEGFGNSHIVVDGTAYLPGNWDVAIVRQALTPLLLNPLVAIVAAVWAASTIAGFLVLRRRSREPPTETSPVESPRS